MTTLTNAMTIVCFDIPEQCSLSGSDECCVFGHTLHILEDVRRLPSLEVGFVDLKMPSLMTRQR